MANKELLLNHLAAQGESVRQHALFIRRNLIAGQIEVAQSELLDLAALGSSMTCVAVQAGGALPTSIASAIPPSVQPDTPAFRAYREALEAAYAAAVALAQERGTDPEDGISGVLKGFLEFAHSEVQDTARKG